VDPFSSREEEVRTLTNSLFDGRIDAARLQRLESLILSDLGCLQIYVEQINFHGVVSQASRTQSPERAALDVLQGFSTAVRLRDRRERWLWSLLTAGVATMILSVTGWMVLHWKTFQSAPVGTISSLSTDVRVGSEPLDLGRIVRQGERMTVAEGVVSLELPDVIVDVVGPATFRINSTREILLDDGRLVAKVTGGNPNFTIRTPVAEVVDLGTEFLVQHFPGTGTDVSVRQGRVQATLLDKTGQPTQRLDLTDSRAAAFRKGSQSAWEVDFHSRDFEVVDRSRGGIRSLNGMLRTSTERLPSLKSGDVLTLNHILVMPEQLNFTLPQDLTVMSISGPVHLPAGSVVSSYLVHYDPPGNLSRAPRGAVTFFDPVVAVIGTTTELRKSDALLGLSETRYETENFRGVELAPDEDTVQISNDMKTVSFHFDMSPPRNLDEVRILIQTAPAH